MSDIEDSGNDHPFIENIKFTYLNAVEEYGKQYCDKQIELAKPRVIAYAQGGANPNWSARILEAATHLIRQVHSTSPSDHDLDTDEDPRFLLLASVELITPGYLDGLHKSSGTAAYGENAHGRKGRFLC